MKALEPLPRKLWLSLLLVALLGTAAAGQAKIDGAVAKQLKAQAEECGRAFVEGAFERLIDCTYPKLVEMAGGRAKLVGSLKKGADEAKAEGFETLSFTTGEPTEVQRVGRQTFAVVPATLRMRAPKEVYVSEYFLLGVSEDGGKSWTFVDGSEVRPERLKVLFPAAARRLRFPAPKPITVEPLP